MGREQKLAKTFDSYLMICEKRLNIELLYQATIASQRVLHNSFIHRILLCSQRVADFSLTFILCF